MSVSKPDQLAFRLLRLLCDGGVHAAEALAHAAGVPVAEVRRALFLAQEWGVPVELTAGRKARLSQAIDWLDPTEISRHTAAQAFTIRVEEVVESTNTELLRAALNGAPGRLVLAAERQTQGRGRRGRSWHAGVGGALTFSLLWRFEQGVGTLAGLGLAVSLGLVRALRELGAAEAMLKWPNDVLWRHHKLAGVLIELQGDVLGPSVAVIGIGLNVRLDAAVRERIDQAVTDLATTGGPTDRNRVLGVTLRHLADVLERFSVRGFAPLRGDWESVHALHGRTAAVMLPDRTREFGRVAGIGDDGALLLQTAAGLRRFHSGEVTLRPLDDTHRRTKAG